MSRLKAAAKKRAPDNTDGKVETRFKAGAEWKGNAAGRPKGARSKLTTEFFEDFYATWQKHGAKALEDVAEKNPKDFVRAAAMLMPKEFEIKTPLDEMTDGELADLIGAVQSLIAASPVLTPAGGERTASKPH